MIAINDRFFAKIFVIVSLEILFPSLFVKISAIDLCVVIGFSSEKTQI